MKEKTPGKEQSCSCLMPEQEGEDWASAEESKLLKLMNAELKEEPQQLI